MHYKNGREAKSGDPVITKDTSNRVAAGTIQSINEGSLSCNGMVACAVPGGFVQLYVTVGDCYHAEDALLAIEPLAMPPKA